MPAAPTGTVRSTRTKDQWHVMLARALGQAVRLTAHELGLLRGDGRKRISPSPSPRPRRTRSRNQALDILLRQLSDLVAAHASSKPSSLKSDPAFWRLIERIHARRPSPRHLRAALRRSGKPAGGAPGSGSSNTRAPRAVASQREAADEAATAAEPADETRSGGSSEAIDGGAEASPPEPTSEATPPAEEESTD